MRPVLAALVLLVVVPSAPVRSAPVPADRDKVKMDERTKAAVGRALRWLKDQQAADGSWGRQEKVAMTSFTLLAFMANGHVPNQGAYGPEVSKAVRFLLACARDDGFILGPGNGNGRMYSHGMATLALTQVFGMTGDEDVKKVLKKAIDLILRAQNSEGGWRYNPVPADADISVTIMQVMALRGAKDSGLHVPDKSLAAAVKYIGRCREPRSGGYTYQARSGGPGYARTAAGVCVLQLSGEYDADEIKQAVNYLQQTGDDRQHYWYGHYYAAHALNQVGGEVWEKYYERMKAALLPKQKSSGEWYESRYEGSYGAVYHTSIAVLILSVPTHYLPIYQK